MALDIGTTIGPYTVGALIGQGGMGEVDQARDTKLDRGVALKVLPEAFTSDPDRLARFEREAKVLASLNHPNIGSIHVMDGTEDTKALPILKSTNDSGFLTRMYAQFEATAGRPCSDRGSGCSSLPS